MDQTPKQQVAEKLRQASNVLVTVSQNPTVDQLSAAIGLSLMLDKLGKHTTTVFSGKVPEAVQFLEPEKTFDSNVDGLRDFIISLDKEKADKLRYKVEDNIVKIFITPYKGKITEKDLEFSQGDYNVDVVIALGVEQKTDLDQAITAHGRILHDATVIAANTGEKQNNIGAINWIEPTSSSLCEMLVSISEALQGGILDAQMSTAFLTGIVAATERFSNSRTSPKVMTMAAQLMAAGANQQLIATNLNVKQGESARLTDANKSDEGELKISQRDESPEEAEAEINKLLHDMDESNTPKPAEATPTPKPKQEDKKLPKPQEATEPDLTDKIDTKNKSLKEIESQLEQLQSKPPEKPKEPEDSEVKDSRGAGPNTVFPTPSLGGTFNATSSQAHEDTEKQKQTSLNKELLSHDIEPPKHDEKQPGVSQSSTPAAGQQSNNQAHQQQLEDARRAVEAAMTSQPYRPDNDPTQSIAARPLPQQQVPPQPPVQPSDKPQVAPATQQPQPAPPPPPMPPQQPPNVPAQAGQVPLAPMPPTQAGDVIPPPAQNQPIPPQFQNQPAPPPANNQPPFPPVR